VRFINGRRRLSNEEAILGCDVSRYLLCKNRVALVPQMLSPDNVCGQWPFEPTAEAALISIFQVVATGQESQSCLCFCCLLQNQVRQATASVNGNDKVR